MKFFLVALGTRGDIEPFLALANILRSQGHEVACCFPEQFAYLVEEEDHDFFSLGPEFINLINSEEGRTVMGGAKASVWKRLKSLYTLYKSSIAINRKVFHLQHGYIEQCNPDQIVFHPKTVYSFTITKIKKTILSPIPYLIHTVRDKPPVGINFYLGETINRWIGNMLNVAIVKNIKQIGGQYLKENEISNKQLKSNIVDTDMMYMVSPSLFERPNYWPEHVQVLGYNERSKTTHWIPPVGLEEFLAKHTKPIVLSFGSMANGKPNEATSLFLDILETNNIPAVIVTSSGGLEMPEKYNKELFYFIRDIPYEWIFPKVYGVIHHGGSGTTHTVVKYGCASLIIPHIIDQFMWNKVLADKGVGPKGISIRKLEREKLNHLIADFYTNESHKKKAVVLGEQMRKEDFNAEIIDFLSREEA